MKALLASLWKRRWCRCILWAGMVLGLTCVHPFPRQLLFGPRFKGWPLCVWENRIGDRVHPERRQANWIQKALAFVGVDEADQIDHFDWASAELLPLFLLLAEDRDERVRWLILRSLSSRREPEVVAMYRRHLQDDDVECRLLAACGLWHSSGDRGAKAALLAIPDDCVFATRWEVVYALKTMAAGDPDLFEPLAKFVDDGDPVVRQTAVSSMASFGKRGAAALRDMILGKNDNIRCYAIGATPDLGRDAVELIPVLEAIRNNPRDTERYNAREALTKIDPERFPAPARTRK